MVGGFSGLVGINVLSLILFFFFLSFFLGAIVVGPRTGDKRAHSVPFQVFGCMILWFGWYGFNCGSTLRCFMLFQTFNMFDICCNYSRPAVN